MFGSEWNYNGWVKNGVGVVALGSSSIMFIMTKTVLQVAVCAALHKALECILKINNLVMQKIYLHIEQIMYMVVIGPRITGEVDNQFTTHRFFSSNIQRIN